MNAVAPETHEIGSFLSVVRWRLWAGKAVEYGRSALWQVGILLLTLAVVHHLFVTVPGSLILLGIAIAVLIMLTRVLLSRPAMATCAAEADRQFGGHALMTTAVECLQQRAGAGNDASRIVLQQACDAAQSWRSEVSRLTRPAHTVATALAIVPLFAAAVLLSLPGAELSDDVAETMKKNVPGVTGKQDNRTRADKDDIATLRGALDDEDSLRKASAANDQPVNERPANAAGNLIASRNLSVEVGTDQPTFAPQIDPRAGVAGQSSDDSDLPGDASARSQQVAQDAATPIQFRGREEIMIQRSGVAVSAGAGRIASYSDTESPKYNSPLSVLPAAAPDTRAQWTVLTPAQAAYARLYLAEPGKAND